jgi:hypothetical protein
MIISEQSRHTVSQFLFFLASFGASPEQLPFEKTFFH